MAAHNNSSHNCSSRRHHSPTISNDNSRPLHSFNTKSLLLRVSTHPLHWQNSTTSTRIRQRLSHEAYFSRHHTCIHNICNDPTIYPAHTYVHGTHTPIKLNLCYTRYGLHATTTTLCPFPTTNSTLHATYSNLITDDTLFSRWENAPHETFSTERNASYF